MHARAPTMASALAEIRLQDRLVDTIRGDLPSRTPRANWVDRPCVTPAYISRSVDSLAPSSWAASMIQAPKSGSGAIPIDSIPGVHTTADSRSVLNNSTLRRLVLWCTLWAERACTNS